MPFCQRHRLQNESTARRYGMGDSAAPSGGTGFPHAFRGIRCFGMWGTHAQTDRRPLVRRLLDAQPRGRAATGADWWTTAYRTRCSTGRTTRSEAAAAFHSPGTVHAAKPVRPGGKHDRIGRRGWSGRGYHTGLIAGEIHEREGDAVTRDRLPEEFTTTLAQSRWTQAPGNQLGLRAPEERIRCRSVAVSTRPIFGQRTGLPLFWKISRASNGSLSTNRLKPLFK